jgi:hypothetical protein
MPVPGKFDDISKAAASVLKDDYQCKGYQVQAKQKTSWDGAVSTTTVDLFAAKGDCKTPAKVSWKFPKPFNLAGFAVEKLEFAPDGKFALDFSAKEALHGVKELTIDKKLTGLSLEGAKVGLSYGGIKDAMVKFETKTTQMDKFTGELLYGGIGGVVVGAKFNGPTMPSLGLNFTSGPFFASVIAQDTFSVFNLHTSYKATNELTVAKTYTHGGKSNGEWSVGAAYKVDGTMTVKKKIDSKMNLSVAVKKDLVKGFNINGGVTYNVTSSESTFGCKVSIE